ncbi:pancreatic progenitor cell differentiation and proliferation factor-like protein [Acipenser ruthenus]|uniref:pancreatic progenitor cell differentiation and proliferation factor-like protein n=1 Tax=Acipenser ruthenus TaxID=7906 RepID=UPI002741E6BD|nr:pancreatic progenitor cell differentiation and proliferation factor-like protein [Acipenser ruthenus]
MQRFRYCRSGVCFSTASLQREQLLSSMAAVPSPSCLLARNQFYRNRLNSSSSLSSGIFTLSKDSEGNLPLTTKSIHQGSPTAVEKSWLSSVFFGSLGQNSNTGKVSSEK